MEERRQIQRHRTLKAGNIVNDRGGAIDCQVRNLSAGGACIEVENQTGIPDDFVLFVESEQLKQPCHVVWRTGHRLGVTFGQ